MWQEARLLCAHIDEACEVIASKRNYGLVDQMRRSAISIPSNISEGFDRRSPASFRYFLLVAKGSAAELRSQLYLCLDRGYLAPSSVDMLQQQCEAVSQMLWGLIRYLEQLIQPQRGQPTWNAERGTRNPPT